MKFLLLWFFIAFLFLPTQNDGREYHYNRPQLPFQSGEVYAQQHHYHQSGQAQHAFGQHAQASSAAARSGTHFVVGAHGTQFDVHMIRSQPVFVGYQPGNAGGPRGGAAAVGNYAPQQPYARTQQVTPHVNPLYHAPPQQSYAQHANYQQQQPHPQQQQHYTGAASNAYGRSIDVPHAYAGGGAGAGVGGGHQGGGYGGAGVGGGQFGGGYNGGGGGAQHGGGYAGGGYNGGGGGAQHGGGYNGVGGAPQHGGGYNGAGAGAQHGGGYAGGGGVGGGQFGGYNGAAQAAGPQYGGNQYAGANFAGAHSQPVGVGGPANAGFGGGSGGGSGRGYNSANPAAEAASQSYGGQYVSQSEAAQLDHYPYKQYNAGDPRAYQRHVTVCYGNGHCEQSTLAPGQIDPKQFPITTAARAQLAPASDKCRRIHESNLGAAQGYSYNDASGGQAAAAYSNANTNAVPPPAYGVPNTNAAPQSVANFGAQSVIGGPIRPRDRRLYPYSEVPIKQDPYN